MTDSAPAVSVVIPYSAEHTPKWMLFDAIGSVLEQQGSNDVRIVVVVDREQRGPAWARNRGLEVADTQYVTFLDGDDVWSSDKLRRQLRRLSETGAGMCVEGTPRSTQKFIRGVFVGSIESLTSSIMIDTELVDVDFEESLTRLEDYLFMMEAASQEGVCFCEDLITIRKHELGLSARINSDTICRTHCRFAWMAGKRVPEARPYVSDFYRQFHAKMAWNRWTDKEYAKTIRHLVGLLQTGSFYRSFVTGTCLLIENWNTILQHYRTGDLDRIDAIDSCPSVDPFVDCRGNEQDDGPKK